MAVRQKDYEDLSRMLPTDAYHKGMTLTWWRPISADPVILKFGGKELHRWDYTPSLTEVFEVCRQLEVNYGNCYELAKQWGSSGGSRGRCDAKCLNYQTKLLWRLYKLSRLFILERIPSWSSRDNLEVVSNIKGLITEIINPSLFRQKFNLLAIKKMVIKKLMVVRASKEGIIPDKLPPRAGWNYVSDFDKPIESTEDALRIFLSFNDRFSIAARETLTSIQPLCSISTINRTVQPLIIRLCSSLNRKFFPTESTDSNIFERLSLMSSQAHTLSLAVASPRTKLSLPRRYHIATYRTETFHISSLSQCNCDCN